MWDCLFLCLYVFYPFQFRIPVLQKACHWNGAHIISPPSLLLLSHAPLRLSVTNLSFITVTSIFLYFVPLCHLPRMSQTFAVLYVWEVLGSKWSLQFSLVFLSIFRQIHIEFFKVCYDCFLPYPFLNYFVTNYPSVWRCVNYIIQKGGRETFQLGMGWWRCCQNPLMYGTTRSKVLL